ncbi:MAG: hypothetical protein Q4D95_05225 [Peptoniphilus sp.]|nr:hypothetical protein [Peptoniphilus sp.]
MLLIIPLILLLLIIIADIILYAVDVMVTPYIIIFLSLLIAFLKHRKAKTLEVSYILAAISLISFIYLKPNYTINQAKQSLKENSLETTGIERLGYVKRKNILVRCSYVFSTEDETLIIFDNINGEFHTANK